MDIEKVVTLPYNSDLKITIPAKTKANIESGHYLPDTYQESIFRKLTTSSKIVRYKRYICCNKYIYDTENEELIAFCKLEDWNKQDEDCRYLVFYTSRYLLHTKVGKELRDWLDYNYYSGIPKDKLQKTMMSQLRKLGFDKDKLINAVNLTIQQTTEVV